MLQEFMLNVSLGSFWFEVKAIYAAAEGQINNSLKFN
jgi:hypothetical protein